MSYVKKSGIFSLSIILFLSYSNMGCGKKESGTQPTAQHTTSVKLEGETPSVHKKTMADEEIEKTKRLLETSPNDAKIHYTLGLLYEAKGMLDESLAAYQKASELNPSMVESLVGQGNILNKKGKS
ncbi:MAG TPA: tetratricopeptide repeat protein, partial [Candidatus Brocadiaceae bacterium]